MQRHLFALAALLGVCAVGPAAAYAGTFTVDPVSTTIGGSRQSTVVTVTNRSADATRFQVTSYGWHQSPAGEMQLQVTDDVMAFPALFVLGPGEQRRVRVAVTAGPTQTERAYRLLVQELPPLDPFLATGGNLGLSVRTKIGIPIFVASASAKPNVRIAEAVIRDGTFVLDLSNDGTAHAIVRKVHATFFDATGRALDDQEVSGWYVLANEHREFRLPSTSAKRARRVQLNVSVDGTTLAKTVDLSGPHS